jgi:uncharacterized membrane protein
MMKSKSLSVIIALVIVTIAMSGTAAAADLTISGDSVTTAPGSSVEVTFTATNDGSKTKQGTVSLNPSSLPASWSVSDISGTDPNPVDNFAVIDNGNSQIFSDINPGETVTVTADVSVPTDAAPGDQGFVAALEDGNGNQIGQATTDISVTSPLSLSGNQVVGVKPGESATFSLTASNSGTNVMNGSISVNQSTVPSGWQLSDVSGTDPNPEDSLSTIADNSEVVYTDIDADEDVSFTGTIAVPDTASTGDYDITTELTSDGSPIESSIITLAVAKQNPAAKAYNTNNKKGIQTTELTTAIGDFRNQALGTSGLITVIEEWRNTN